MIGTHSQLTLSQKFSLHAQCSKGFRVKRICISSICQSTNIYLCAKSQDACQCHYQHKKCPSISYEAFCQKFENYKKNLKTQMHQYIQRFEKVFINLENKLTKQKKLFTTHFQDLLFGNVKSSIQRKIQNKNFGSLTSFEINNFLTSLQISDKQINCGKLTVNEAHQLDKKIAELFILIETLYQKKVTKNQVFSKQKPMRSSSSCCFEKKLSVQKTQDQFRKSSIFEVKLQRQEEMMKTPFHASKQLFSQNLSWFLEKKNINDYFQDKISQFRPPKINLDYPKSIQSKIIQNVQTINHFIGKKIQSYEIFFRASENNFQIKKFYQQIQNLNKSSHLKQNISGYLFIIKTEFNRIFGAFTELSLQEISNKILQKNQSKNESQSENEVNPEELKSIKRNKYCSNIKSLTFLFSFSLRQKYHLKDPQKALYIGSNTLGFGNSDIRIRNKSNLFRQSSCRIGNSFIVGQSVKHSSIDYDKKCRQITGSRYGKKFKIDEWECFKVTYSKQNYK